MYSGPMTLPAIVEARAQHRARPPAVRFEDDVLTGGQLHENALKVAQALTALGLKPGDKAALMLDNGREAIEAWFGMTYAGIVEVPINTAFKGDLLTYMLTQAECKAIITKPEFVERIEVDIQVLVVGESYDEALAAAPATPTGHTPHPNDPSVILFTSGTTGPSKGVVLSHNANFRLCRNVCEIMAYERDEVLFTAFPLFHVNAKYTTVLPALYVGGEVVMRPRFSASRFWDICREEGVTAFNFMGALLMMLHKQPPKPHDRDHKVAKAYGAPAPVTIFDAFQERFGVQAGRGLRLDRARHRHRQHRRTSPRSAPAACPRRTTRSRSTTSTTTRSRPAPRARSASGRRSPT